MKNKLYFYRLIIAVSFCFIVYLLFVGIKNNKIGFFYNAQYASNIEPLKDSEIGNDVLNLQETFVTVAKRIKPAVVNISTVQMLDYPQYDFYFGDPLEEFFGDFFGDEKPRKKQRKYKAEGGGTGVIIDPDGYVLTNEHVIHGADEIKVTAVIDNNEKTFTGKVIGKDSRTDLAIVKINSSSRLPAAPLGDSGKIRVGEWVIAIGSPFGLEQTVTSGIISALRQSIRIEDKEYRDFIQTDAAINRGNSGGPLCNIRGEIIGINTAIYAPTGVFSGIGFAIPINRAKEILDDLIHKGKVVRGWLGVEIIPVDPAIKKQFNLKNMEGALVNNVLRNSPAQKAGVKRGDCIIEFNKRKIVKPADLQASVSETNPKKTVPVKIIRNGNELNLELTIGEMPDEAGDETSIKQDSPEAAGVTWLGITVNKLSGSLMQKYKIPEDETGVVVTGIDSKGRGYDIGINEGDLIKSINNIETKTIETFNKATKKVNLSDGIVFDIVRNGKPVYLSYSGK
ncbi:MAG: hypothetical protein A2252_10655 [Elusimicrobia bacterium RIFOXYA2_FULL_39_19]|nr:MAG: hypothetical protein A2252_10655 [Elusimicrobia bacterium RIFOXYA2_FULL_39_19]